MRVQLLGEITIVDDDGRVVELSTQMRRLVAMLAVAGRAGVSGDRIAEHLFAGAVEGSALRTALSRLRKCLGGRVETTVTGYRLALGADDVDVDVFEQLLDQAREGAPAQRRLLLRDALGLWRGPVLAEFADEEWAMADVARLGELRAVAVEDLADALLADQRPAEAVVLLEEHILDHRYRERPVVTLMRALAASGRSTEAVRAYQRFRLVLRDEVGTEPTAALRRLEADLLASADDLAPDVSTPPMRVPVRGNLPRFADEFVGRVDAMARLATEVRARPLVTVVGPGGAGKTRLAVETGHAMAAEFPDGVWLIDLAALTDLATVELEVASVLGVASEPGRTLTASIASALRGTRMLLIIDNCEHVAGDVADLVTALVGAGPDLRVLATSRQLLGVRAERVHTLAPLDDGEGVELFCERARAVDDRFAGEDRAAIESICRQLDGMPLAIELAAARTRSLTPADILAHLDDRFRILRRARRDGDRHHTLHATVTWSYQLLDGAERAVFDLLSVFAGGFSLPAAEFVCGAVALDAPEVLDVLTALVDKSMVLADAGGPTVRYRLLETLRQYGLDRLTKRDEVEVARLRHFDYYYAFAELLDTADPSGRVPPNELVDLDWTNFRAAISWGKENDQASRAGWMIVLIGTRITGVRDEYARWLHAALAALPGGHPATAALYTSAASEASHRGEYAEALTLADCALRVAPHSPNLHSTRALALCHLGRFDEAIVAARVAVAGNHDEIRRSETFALNAMCLCAAAVEPDALPDYVERLHTLAAQTHHPFDVWSADTAAGLLQLVKGEQLAALDLFRSALESAPPIPANQSATLIMIARTTVAADLPEASAAIRASIEFSAREHYWADVRRSLKLLADHWFATGRPDDSAVVLGGLEAAHRAVAQSRAATRSRVVDVMSTHPELADQHKRGAALSQAELVAFALDRLDAVPSASPDRTAL